MLSTHTHESGSEQKEIKQRIKSKLALSLKALQKRYVTTDAVVTSEDADANLLCCALEAVFVHGIKNKYIRVDGRGRKAGPRGPLPQPVFWTLLKTVTHRDVITELERLSFINTDVGRCRAWVRLALNDGLVECYLASLLREGSKLTGYYQSVALLLDPEEREVLLSYLQGLASLSFQLSYKSAVLNEWTVTPLALAGLCPATDSLDLPPGAAHSDMPKRKESWDTVSQSSGGSDTIEVQRGLGQGRGMCGKTGLTSSNLSLDTTGSSQLSSSLSSDSLLQGNSHKSPDKESWPCDLNITNVTEDPTKALQDMLSDFGVSTQSSQDSMHEDSYISSVAPDHLSETAASSSSDSETHCPLAPVTEAPAPMPTPNSEPCEPMLLSPDEVVTSGETSTPTEPPTHLPSAEKPLLTHCTPPPLGSRNAGLGFLKMTSTSHTKKKTSEPEEALCFNTVLVNGTISPTVEPESPQSPPSVVHRRQIGLSNPFRGLLKLGHLERRGAVGMWREYYCELSPFEFRLYLNAEERTCSDNCSLLRCEDIRPASADGRFELAFPGKRLYLRAPSQDEAEDWVDRVIEAVNKCRPAHRDDQWEVLHSSDGGEADSLLPPLSSTPSSPERGGLEQGEQPELDWTRSAEPEPDAIKEALLYLSQDERTWTPFIFSLSLEALKAFQEQDGRKVLRLTHPIESIRDVVPDASLGSPAFFKVLTARNTLKLRAQNETEAHSWRSLIRGALNSYLDTWEDGGTEGAVTQGGNIHRLVQHSLKADGVLLPHLCTIPTEKGLDAQSFKCAGCPRQIGFSFGKARLCEFSGLFYCDSCHHGDTIVIPSRMVHNWDLMAREVSRPALKLLAQIAREPLLNLESLNPGLCEHAEPMAQAHSMRQRLRLLGEYLLTCRSDVSKKIQAKLDHRNYLLESCNLYSVTDLREIADGQYESFLLSLIQFASSHVYHCDLCSQRGFICQICNSNTIIFPFEFETTSRCKVCKTVFHTACKVQVPSCPRCLRLQKYLERELQD
ncbi:hypothetical protein AGOR_G00095860 [Albula goreensis]|uniref:Pleckstrin homology domain-containing family M member 1 n=1 Tax=Albula goreensis TaxID=1534307 RepID=A0A8T3DL19_9TELE|nr:hypothetical protein AGOR_G00095860 [Albula goreensis]